MNVFLESIFIFGAVLLSSAFNLTSRFQHREHKIHNIVLYPDKHSWCIATAIVQVVGHPGCNAVKIDNNVCVGACFSYIIPRTVPETPGDVLPYCDSCQPDRVSWKKVTLECTEGNYKNQNLTKYVEFIHDCNCGTCKEQLVKKLPSQEEINTDRFNTEIDLVDEYLLNDTIDILSTHSNNSFYGYTNHSKSKSVLSNLLKTLNNENENVFENNNETKGLHKDVWKNFLEKVEAINNTMDSKELNEIIKSVEEESKIKFNYKRLKTALMKFKKYHAITKANIKISEEETAARHHLTVLPTDSADFFASGLYSKLSPKLPVAELEKEAISPMLDVAPKYLKPASSGSEISYRDNLEILGSSKIDKFDKSFLNYTKL